jgi:REP element-mobilizing transposase RayT
VPGAVCVVFVPRHLARRSREAIYRDDADRTAWLDLFGDVCERFNWRCHGYCQMTNHYHAVVETPEANLSKGIDRHIVKTRRMPRRQRRRAGPFGPVVA